MSDINSDKPSGKNKKEAKSGSGILVAILVFLAIVGSYIGPTQDEDAKEERAPTETDKMLARVRAEESVRQMLRDPDSAEFTQVEVFVPDDGGPMITCGYVNSRNGFGGMSGAKRFVASATVILEEQVDAQAMQDLWTQYCS